jgi:hypothetical protein
MNTQLQEKVLKLNFDLQESMQNFLYVTFGVHMLEWDTVVGPKAEEVKETIGNIGELLKGKFTAKDLPVDNRDWLSTFLFNSLDLVIAIDHMNKTVEKLVGEKVNVPTDDLRKDIAEIINF